MVGLGVPGRAGDAPRGGAQVVAAARATAAVGQPSDVVAGKGGPIPATGVATPTTGVRVVRLLPRPPGRALAARLTVPRAALPSAVAASPETFPASRGAIARVRVAPRPALPFRHRVATRRPLAAPSAPRLAAPRPVDLAIGAQVRVAPP